MKLFEGGILDKITNDEYERMFQSMQVNQMKNDGENGKALNKEEKQQQGKEEQEEEDVDEKQGSNSISGDENLTKTKVTSEKELTALSLRMLQGTFYLAIIGYILAFLTLLVEIGLYRMSDTMTLPHFSITNCLRTFMNRFRLHH
jgi:hypothetical protein